MEKATNPSSWPVAAIAVLALIAMWSYASTAERTALQTSGSSLLAEAAGADKPVQKYPVIVAPIGESRRVNLESIQAGDVQTPPQNCADGTLKRIFQEDQKEFQRMMSKNAQCVAGMMEATVLDGKIGNAGNSIEVIDILLDLLTKTKENLEQKKTLDGLAIAGIPAGAKVQTSIENAESIGMVCLGPQGKQGGSPKAVGRYSPVPDLSFLASVRKHKKSFDEIQKGIKDLNKKIQEETDRLAKAIVDPETGKATDPVTGKPIKGPGVSELMSQGFVVIDTIKKDFMPIDATVLAPVLEKHPNFKVDAVLGIVIGLNKDDKDKPILDNPARWITTLIHTITALKPGADTMSRPYYDGTFSIVAGDEVLSIQINGSPILPLPEPSIFNAIKTMVIKKTAELEKERAKFQQNLKTAQTRLAALQKTDYNCR